MIALNESAVESPRTPRVRPARKPVDQSTRPAPARVAKSKDAQKTKVTFYLDSRTAAKLAVSAVIRRSDQSDVANEILSRALSSVTFYDSTRPSDSTLPVAEDRQDVAA